VRRGRVATPAGSETGVDPVGPIDIPSPSTAKIRAKSIGASLSKPKGLFKKNAAKFAGRGKSSGY